MHCPVMSGWELSEAHSMHLNGKGPGTALCASPFRQGDDGSHLTAALMGFWSVNCIWLTCLCLAIGHVKSLLSVGKVIRFLDSSKIMLLMAMDS